MLNIARAVHSPRALQALTGVSRAEFERLEGRLTVVVEERLCQEPSQLVSERGCR
jgi:hypothetical protein